MSWLTRRFGRRSPAAGARRPGPAHLRLEALEERR
jgi:hypothetical protein